MKKLFIILFIFCCFLGFAQKPSTTVSQPQYTSEDTLHWSKDRKLNWDDFKGAPDTFFVGGAGTSSDFFYRSFYIFDTVLVFAVDCIFFKGYSWVKEAWRTPYALNHEQIHFDITEIYARKLRMALKNYKLNKATVIEDIKNISDSIKKEKNQKHQLYDKETTYPINKKEQKKWDIKIATLLKETQ